MPVFTGTSGTDNFTGTGADDTMLGYGGTDTLNGGRGDQLIVGGDGRTYTTMGPGDDRYFGMNGDDGAYGDTGDDTFYGGNGTDDNIGAAGDDVFYGGNGNDLFNDVGFTGDDSAYGGAGNDSLYGGDGNDLLEDGAAPTEAAGTLTNGDFDTRTSGWTLTTKGSLPPDVAAGNLRFNTGGEGAGDAVSQAVTTTIGATYNLVVNAFEIGTGVSTQTVRVDVLDCDGNIIATTSVTLANGGSQAITLAYQAVSTTTTIRVANTVVSASANSDLAVSSISNTLAP